LVVGEPNKFAAFEEEEEEPNRLVLVDSAPPKVLDVAPKGVED
jgi:hypothetical protein